MADRICQRLLQTPGTCSRWLLLWSCLIGCQPAASNDEEGSEQTPGTSGTQPAIQVGQQTVVSNSDAILALFPANFAFGSVFQLSGRKPALLDEVAALENRLHATDRKTCAYRLTVTPTPVNLACFSPAIEFAGHPEVLPASGTFNTGITAWTASETTGEACIAAKINQSLATAGWLASESAHLLAMGMCAANLGDVFPPAEDDTMSDATATVNFVLGELAPESLEKVTFTRRPASSEEFGPDYVTQMVLSDSNLGSFDIALRTHRKLTTNDTMSGRLVVAFENAATDHTMYLEIEFARTTEEELWLAYQFRQGNYQDELSDDSGRILYDTSANFLMGRALLNTKDGTGRWMQAEASSGAFHPIVIQGYTEPDEEGTLGCAYLGHGPSIEALLTDGDVPWLDRMVCLPGTSGEQTGQPFSQQQCLVADRSGVFLPASSNLSYVPRSSCGSESEDNSQFSWRVSGTEGTLLPFSNGNGLVSLADDSVAADLVPIPAIPPITEND